MSTALPPLADQGEDSLRIDTSGPSNELINFPSEATFRHAGTVENGKHASELASGDGIVVIATFKDLVDFRVAMQALMERFANETVTVHILAGEPTTYGNAYRSYIHYAKCISGAKQVLIPSHEFAILLDVHIPKEEQNRIRNGLLLIVNGKIVWKSIDSLTKPNRGPSHNLEDLKTAIAYHSR